MILNFLERSHWNNISMQLITSRASIFILRSHDSQWCWSSHITCIFVTEASHSTNRRMRKIFIIWVCCYGLVLQYDVGIPYQRLWITSLSSVISDWDVTSTWSRLVDQIPFMTQSFSGEDFPSLCFQDFHDQYHNFILTSPHDDQWRPIAFYYYSWNFYRLYIVANLRALQWRENLKPIEHDSEASERHVRQWNSSLRSRARETSRAWLTHTLIMTSLQKPWYSTQQWEEARELNNTCKSTLTRKIDMNANSPIQTQMGIETVWIRSSLVTRPKPWSRWCTIQISSNILTETNPYVQPL